VKKMDWKSVCHLLEQLILNPFVIAVYFYSLKHATTQMRTRAYILWACVRDVREHMYARDACVHSGARVRLHTRVCVCMRVCMSACAYM
jgi:hypothetical protein